VRRRFWPLAGVLVLVGVSPALANAPPAAVAPAPAPSATPPSAPRIPRAPQPRKPKAPPPPAAPSAALTLHVTPGALGTPWIFEVTNADTIPLRVIMDARLLALDVRAPRTSDGKPSPIKARCALPGELRPTDDDKARVLLPGVTYVNTFDPRLYCWDAHDAAALAPGAEVTARLGWTGTGASPPFVADQIDGGEARSGVKEVSAEPVTVPDELADDEDSDGLAEALDITSRPRIDTDTGLHLAVLVTVENTTSRTVRLMLRPETLTFRVSSPRGVRSCGWTRGPGAPIAEVFTAIPPHGKASTEVLLSSVCPDGTLDAAGLYSVRAGIDTRNASGRSIGLDTFDGRVKAKKASLVRVRRDRAAHP